MNRNKLFKWVSVIVVCLVAVGLFGASMPTSASPVQQNVDEDFPIFIDITGQVTALAANSITVDELTIKLLPTTPLPAGLTIGTVVTIRAYLGNDDTLLAVAIIIGPPPPSATFTPTAGPSPTASETPTAGPSVTFTPTPAVTPTAAATLSATLAVTPPVIKGCGLPKAVLALTIAQAYNIPLDQLEYWHCNGNAYGVIARAYLIVFGSTNGATVDGVLKEHGKGKKWTVIITTTGARISPDNTTITVNGGKVVGKPCPPGQAKKGNCGPAANNGQGNKGGKK